MYPRIAFAAAAAASFLLAAATVGNEKYTPAERRHWAFRPRANPAIPSIPGVTHPIDAFLAARLQKEGLIRVRHGSGAVVISQTLKEKPDDRLRAQLRTALTQLILAGLKHPEIKALINEELDELLRPVK